MELIFDNAGLQAPEITAKNVKRTILKKKHKLDEILNSTSQGGNLDMMEEASLDNMRIYSNKDYQKEVLIGQKIPSTVPTFTE